MTKGASVSPTGLGGAEAPEPPSRLGPADAIPSADSRVRVILDCKWEDLQHALDMVLEARPMFDRCKDDRPGWGWFLGRHDKPALFVRRTKQGYSATDTNRPSGIAQPSSKGSS